MMKTIVLIIGRGLVVLKIQKIKHMLTESFVLNVDTSIYI